MIFKAFQSELQNPGIQPKYTDGDRWPEIRSSMVIFSKCYIIQGIGVSECSGNRGWDMVRQVARDHSPSSDLICLIP